MVEQPESNELARSGARAKQMPEIFKTQQLQSKEWAIARSSRVDGQPRIWLRTREL